MKKEKIITVDGQTLLDMRLPQIRFVVDRLLPQGLHILAGSSKTGKSWLLLLLSLRVAQGKPFWNLQTEKGTVLSLCLEDSLNRIQQRLMDLTEDAPENLHFATLSKSLSDGLCGQIEEFITEHPDTNLVIIDTLQKVRENSGESNLYATDYKDIGLLKALADKYHIAVVVVQHLRKQFDSDPHNMVTGSTGLLGAADGSYVFRYAVEMELIMRMFSEITDFTPSEIEDMRKDAIRNVRRTRGKVRLDDLFKRKDTQSL